MCQINYTLMKKTIETTQTFNDYFTNYVDKIETITIVVDTDNCKCNELEKCSQCKLIERYENQLQTLLLKMQSKR